MKYNPKLNETAAVWFTDLHPYQDVSTVQGALELLHNLASDLGHITGMDAVTRHAQELRQHARELAAETERLRRMTPAMLSAITSSGLNRLLTPKRWGGMEASWRTYLDALVEVSKGCASGHAPPLGDFLGAWLSPD